MEFPRFFAMQTSYQITSYGITPYQSEMICLRYINDDDQSAKKVPGLLNFSGKEAVSHLTKFEIEMAEGGTGLVHIKCCYNNKYWQRWLSGKDDEFWIVAGANEREEDTSKSSCTLFELIQMGTMAFQFRHVQLGRYLNFYPRRGPFMYEFCITADSRNTGSTFEIIDWATFVILPKHVAFKGQNHPYVKAIDFKNHLYLQFSADNSRDPMVGNEIFRHDSGSIRIKNNHFKKFWRRNNQDWITIDADESSIHDKDTLFSPIIVDNNVIALRNEGNSKFCKLLTKEEETSCLSATDLMITNFSRMEVEDLVRSSCIYDVNYHLMDERIYDQTILTVASADAVNNTGETNHMDVKLSYTDVMTWSMSSNVSSKFGYKSEVTASIPKIANAKAKIASSFSGGYIWGKTEEMKGTMEVVYHAIVPPMTKVKVKLLATKGSCDIPFSYTRDDVLNNRRHVTDDMKDGIYTCSNCFDFNYETSEEPI